MKQRCIDEEVGRKVSLAITFDVAKGEGLFLQPEYCKHLEECKCCRDDLPKLFEKGAASRRSTQAWQIFELAERGDSSILRRVTRSGTALFQPYEHDPAKGLVVLVGTNNSLYDPEEMSVEEFERL